MDNFDDIRPFSPEEMTAAIEEIKKEEYFKKALSYVIPDVELFLQRLSQVKSNDEFQRDMLFPVLKWLLGIVSESIDGEGFSYIEQDKGYTYISNHRDILTDALFLAYLLSSKVPKWHWEIIFLFIHGCEHWCDYAKV